MGYSSGSLQLGLVCWIWNILLLYENFNFCYRLRRIWLLDPILRQLNPVHTFEIYLFNNILPVTNVSSNVVCPSGVFQPKFWCNFFCKSRREFTILAMLSGGYITFWSLLRNFVHYIFTPPPSDQIITVLRSQLKIICSDRVIMNFEHADLKDGVKLNLHSF